MNDRSPVFTRRHFLRTTLLGGAMTWTVPSFVQRTFGAMSASAADSAVQIQTGRDGRILVLLQLAGGNDGLNTVVPYANDHYHRLRPQLRVPESGVLPLNDEIGFHPSLKGMRALFDEGELGIVQGVGYPNPNRSHFRSTEIWATASDARRTEPDGWLGRFFDNHCDGSDPAPAISLTSETPQTFASAHPRVVSFTDPSEMTAGDDDEDLQNPMTGASISGISGGTSFAASGSQEDFLRRTALDARLSSDAIQSILARSKRNASFPPSKLGRDLQTVARLIAGGMTTRVYYVSQGGYDTHAGQAGTHDRLLADLDSAVRAFAGALRDGGNLDRVVLMTFSEFGRRVAENGSAGTDHGAAAPLFMLGGSAKGGIHGPHPRLDELFQGDLVHHTDFRMVYAAVLEEWLGVQSAPILRDRFQPAPLFGVRAG